MTIINELRPKYALKLLLIISGVASSTYKYNNKNVDKDQKNQDIMNCIKECFEEHKGRYGYRRITLTLQSQGYIVNHKKVKRLMKIMNLFGYVPKAKYKSYTGDMNGTVKNILLKKDVDEENHTTKYLRVFMTEHANQIWGTDVTEFHIASGKLYLSPILDFHTREIISYNVSKSPNFDQTKDMVSKAFNQYENLKDLVMHSDQGWQYQMQLYHKLLNDRGISQSMSRKGNCLDNAPMENFFGIMKKEMFIGKEYTFNSLEELEFEIHEYIEYYNNKRISLKLKGLTPVQYRNQSSSLI